MVFPVDQAEVAFYRLLRSRFRGACLEVGAGCGRLAPSLASEGLSVFLEPSAGMLARWRPETAGAGPRTRGCAEALPFRGSSFDLLVFAYNGLHCILDPADRRRFLEEAGRVLRPGGWILLETCPGFATRPLEEDCQRYDFCDGLRRIRLVESVRRQSDTGRISFDMRYTAGGGEIRIPLDLALIQPDALLDEIRSAGLSPLHVWGDYDFSMLGADSPRMLTVASRGDSR